MNELRDIKPPVPIEGPVHWGVWLALALGAALALLLVASWLRRRARRLTPPLSPEQAAIGALTALREARLDTPEAVRRYYYQLSGVVRAYVEARWALNATDLTSEEILARLSGAPVPGAQQERLRAFLLACDRVKFAGHAPTQDAVDEDFGNALRLVRETEEHLRREAERVAEAS